MREEPLVVVASQTGLGGVDLRAALRREDFCVHNETKRRTESDVADGHEVRQDLPTFVPNAVILFPHCALPLDALSTLIVLWKYPGHYSYIYSGMARAGAELPMISQSYLRF